jgi:lysophospholipid acyltransferase (LPLAT)-like uncharacterized protein
VSKSTEATIQQKVLGQVNALVLPRALDLLNFRIAHYDRSVDPARPEYNEHVIFAFWHEYIGVVLPRWGHTPLSILVSQHRDGEWVNQTALALGLRIVRGSSSRGGSSAIRQLKKNCKTSSLTLTPDGPRGPRREMALGPIFLASLLGLPVVPVGVGIDNPYRLKTWDRFAIPKPFSRVRMIFGPKIYIPRKPSREKLEANRLAVQNLMNDLCDHAESWACSGKKMLGQQPFVRARRSNQITFPDQPPVASEALSTGEVSPAPENSQLKILDSHRAA